MRNFNVHKRKYYFYLGFLSIYYLAFLYAKVNLGDYTPDELFYTSNDFYSDSLSFRFLITKLLFTFMFEIHEYLLPICNIIIIILFFRYLYRNSLKRQIILPTKVILLIFLLPSVNYFTVAYLRDIYIFLLTLLLVCKHKDLGRLYILTIFLFISLLRNEAGVVILIALFLSKIFMFKKRVIIPFNLITIVFLFIITWMSLFVLFENDYIWNNLYSIIWNYEKTTDYYGILQVPVERINVINYSVINWFAYYAPFFFKTNFSSFTYFMLFDSIIVGLLFFRAIFMFSSNRFNKDNMYRIAFFIFLLTFFTAIPESVPETMYRHRMSYLPFLIYLNINKKLKSHENFN